MLSRIEAYLGAALAFGLLGLGGWLATVAPLWGAALVCVVAFGEGMFFGFALGRWDAA